MAAQTHQPGDGREAATQQAEADRRRQTATAEAGDIMMDAEREAKQIAEDAAAEALSIRSDGQVQSARIIAEAHDPDLDALITAIDGYRAAMDQNTTIVLEGGKEFFQLLEGAPVPSSQPASATTQSRPTPSATRPDHP